MFSTTLTSFSSTYFSFSSADICATLGFVILSNMDLILPKEAAFLAELGF
jgi:hypothetical protein